MIRIDALGEAELLAGHLGLKMAHPTRTQALLLRLHHHLIAHDRGVDLAGVHLVIRAHPGVIGNAANEEDERCPKDRPIPSKAWLTSSSLFQQLRSIKHHHTAWMIIASRRSNTPRLNNGIHHRLLNRTVLKRTTRIPRPSKIQIIHNQALQIQRINLKQNKGYPKPLPAKRSVQALSIHSGIKGRISQAPIAF